ncbi:MAG: N-acetylmuramoyl-L-alanine amidase [Bacteroidia bacterium]|nr:N-acetylmuramoyl-L-alanine amidase [Bacteroidia bacterium]
MFSKHNFAPFLVLFLFLLVGNLSNVHGQQGKYKAYFDEAYEKYPLVPQGLLEAVAYTNTRLTHLNGQVSCQDIPTYFGVMGLVDNGQGYFTSTLEKVAQLSGYSKEEIKEDPRINILAYAAAYSKLQQSYRLENQRVETHQVIVKELSEIPQDGELKNRYANDQQFYGILREMQQPHTKTGHRLQRSFDVKDVFGAENYRVLSSPKVTVSAQRVSTENGEDFRVEGGTTCTTNSPKPDFKGAVWKKANSRNYGSRNGSDVKYITIHTIQGSYAGAISWFRNQNARVSAHYIIRSSDGQVTQMVCEKDKAFHVKTDNAEAIGIEHEGFIDDGIAWYTQEMYEASAELVRDICQRHGIDPLKTFAGPSTTGVDVLSNSCYHIKGHQHFRGNNHIDPGPFWDWERYYRLINGKINPQVFTSKNGNIYDSGKKSKPYKSQERRAYLIKPKDAVSITLDFLEFELEGTAKNPFDYLDIYDGEGPNGRFLGRFTGTRSPGSLISNSGAFYLEFRSDCRVEKKGFHLKYRAQTESGSCAAPKSLIATDVFPFGATLKWGGDAEAYVIQIKQRNETNWQEYSTKTNQLLVSGLMTNGVYEWQVRAACSDESSAWVGQTFITPNLPPTDSPKVYTIRANSGKFLDSGGGLGPYKDKEKYIYRIIPPDGGKVELSFTSFKTEDKEDFLTIFDGLSTDPAKKIGSFSGSKLPDPVSSTGNGMTILFESDPRVVDEGWIATWRSSKLSTNDPGTGDPGTTDPGTGSDPKPPTKIDIGTFDPNIYIHKYAPETNPNLNAKYESSLTVNFKDRDRSGRGFANRFYTVATKSSDGFWANGKSGFFYDDFSGRLNPGWTAKSGTWFVQDGKLVQSDAAEGNSNLYAELKQDDDATYVYSWTSLMKGTKDNTRYGMHFFCSEPEKPNRGNSYFIWIRKTDEADYIEIYKSAFDQFDRKERKEIKLGINKAHNYKVIYNPVRGKIEVYMDNRFAASWQDSNPLKSGKGISLRTGNSVTVYDDLRVYKNRVGSVKVPTLKANAPVDRKGEFLVESLVIDGFIHWSKAVSQTSVLGESLGTDPGDPKGDPTDPDPGKDLPTFNRDFEFDLIKGNDEEVFVLASYKDGSIWKANPDLGFLRDDFVSSRFTSGWIVKGGNWKVDPSKGKLVQTDINSTNSNLYLPLKQNDKQTYLYQFKAKLTSSGSNQRFGLHFFSSAGSERNRGTAYLLWFRNQGGDQGKVEIYRSEKNDMPGILEAETIRFQKNLEYDVKIVYDPEKGQIKAYLNNREVISWIDSKTPHRKGSFVSLRTGNAAVEIDDFRVYLQQSKSLIDLTVGESKSNMLRSKSQGNAAGGRLEVIRRTKDGKWKSVETSEFIIR